MEGKNPPYEGYVISHRRMSGIVPGKIYQTDIRGRAVPEEGERDKRREWALSPLDFEEVVGGLETELARDESRMLVPRVAIVLPHYTRIYFVGSADFGGEAETNWDNVLYRTPSFLSTPELVVKGGTGCDGEVAILGEERKFWNGTQTVEAYLEMFVPVGSLGRVEEPNKLADYMARVRAGR
ncbi:MAG: hypothetical protein ABIA93_06755 [Candidatus Woesearchaeota archaeon]